MTTLLTGIARPMSGGAYNEDGESIALASRFQLIPALHRDGRTDHYAMVTSGGIWSCDGLGHMLGYGHLLSKRHGINTPAEDLALLGYPVQP